MVDPQEKSIDQPIDQPSDDVAAFEAQERVAREAHSAGTSTYLYQEFHDRAVALGLPKERLARLKRAWQYSLDRRREEIKSSAHSVKAAEVIRRNIDSLEPQKEQEEEEPEQSAYSDDVFRPAPLPPESASKLETLTYPRGLVGHVMEYMLDTNALPDRWMALAGALSVCGKCLDRKVLGPEENSVVLFILILAESGAGKNHILNCIKTILAAVGLEDDFIGTGIASMQSVEQVLEGMGGEDAKRTLSRDQMRLLIELLPYHMPKLSATAHVNLNFAEQLEKELRCIERSGIKPVPLVQRLHRGRSLKMTSRRMLS